jgi:hypothetical protein
MTAPTYHHQIDGVDDGEIAVTTVAQKLEEATGIKDTILTKAIKKGQPHPQRYTTNGSDKQKVDVCRNINILLLCPSRREDWFHTRNQYSKP